MVASPVKETAQQVQTNPSGQVMEAGSRVSEDIANSDVIQPIPATSVLTGKSKYELLPDICFVSISCDNWLTL